MHAPQNQVSVVGHCVLSDRGKPNRVAEEKIIERNSRNVLRDALVQSSSSALFLTRLLCATIIGGQPFLFIRHSRKEVRPLDSLSSKQWRPGVPRSCQI